MSLRRLSIRVALAVAPVVIVAAAQAGIDVATTESGAVRLSGGREQIKSWGVERMLMTANNELDAQGFPLGSGPCGAVDASLGVMADNQHWLVGYITERRNGVHLTYDRLARLPVLQVLGRDDDEQGPTPREHYDPAPAEVAEVGYPTGAHSVQSSPGAREKDEGTNHNVPEPASLTLLALGGLAATRRRRKQARAD